MTYRGLKSLRLASRGPAAASSVRSNSHFVSGRPPPIRISSRAARAGARVDPKR